MSLLLVSALALSGCDQAQRDPPAPKEKEHAVGRYQMLPGPDGSVYVLDTADGWIRDCYPDGAKSGMTCSAGAQN